MTTYEERTGQIHRFHDLVAIHLPTGLTEYFTPLEAECLAKALRDCARDIKARPFLESSFQTKGFSFLPLQEGYDKPRYQHTRKEGIK